jgi:anti-sigma regulatory factor (Ser/Thr protein kinase)
MTFDAPGPERREFEAVPSSARAARRFVTDLLRLDGAPAAVINDCSLVVSELVTNVIEHSGGQRVEVAVDLADPQWWRLEVVGAVPTAPKQLAAPETWTVGGANDLSGRGLGIVRQLMDDVAINASDDLITVTCRRRRSDAHERSGPATTGPSAS